MQDFYGLIPSLKKPQEIAALLDCNEQTEQFGLVLSPTEVNELIESKNETLKEHRRVEFGQGILEKLIYTFCDSPYIGQESYLEVLTQLQDIFFLYKNESMDLLSDDELLTFMKEQFEGVCYGDANYLEDTCLPIFCDAVRAGYKGYIESGGHNEYEHFDEVKRWDKDLYLQVLKELCWE